tara:strand:+ start:932 stop:1726 length:795 start_codon:yes stop_codon:yes gene_type:complete
VHELGASVIIPTFNRAEWVSELVSQLCNQEKRVGGLEILLINDNGNPDVFRSARAAAEGTDVDLRCFDTGYAGFGACLARNIGIAFARYALCVFLDDDVTVAKDLIFRHQSSAMPCLRIGRIDSLISKDGQEEILPDRRQILHGEDGHLSDVTPALGQLHGGHFSIPTALAVALGGFDEAFLNEEEEDLDFGARAMMATQQLVILASAVVLHRGLDSFSLRERGEPGGNDLPRRGRERFMERSAVIVNGGQSYFEGPRWASFQR